MSGVDKVVSSGPYPSQPHVASNVITADTIVYPNGYLSMNLDGATQLASMCINGRSDTRFTPADLSKDAAAPVVVFCGQIPIYSTVSSLPAVGTVHDAPLPSWQPTQGVSQFMGTGPAAPQPHVMFPDTLMSTMQGVQPQTPEQPTQFLTPVSAQQMSNRVIIDALIVGAGPAGIALSACLKKEKVNHIIIEKGDCIAPLWQRRTYPGLVLQRSTKNSQLPYKHFPKDTPKYPTREDFITYIIDYTKELNIIPQLNECVTSAKYDKESCRWTVFSEKKVKDKVLITEYTCKVLAVATGRDSEPVEPKDIEGLDNFKERIHSQRYTGDEKYIGKTVLVIGTGDSATDILLSLIKLGAYPSLVVRNNSRHLFSKTITARKLSKMQMNFGKFERTDERGDTVFNVFPKIKKFNSDSVDLEKGGTCKIDYVIMATGYSTNVAWLQVPTIVDDQGAKIQFFDDKGNFKEGIEYKHMEEARLGVVGFTKSGLKGIKKAAPEVAMVVEHC